MKINYTVKEFKFPHKSYFKVGTKLKVVKLKKYNGGWDGIYGIDIAGTNGGVFAEFGTDILIIKERQRVSIKMYGQKCDLIKCQSLSTGEEFYTWLLILKTHTQLI